MQESVSVLLFAQLDFSDFKKKIHVTLKKMLQKRVKLFFQQQMKCKTQKCGFITLTIFSETAKQLMSSQSQKRELKRKKVPH